MASTRDDCSHMITAEAGLSATYSGGDGAREWVVLEDYHNHPAARQRAKARMAIVRGMRYGYQLDKGVNLQNPTPGKSEESGLDEK